MFLTQKIVFCAKIWKIFKWYFFPISQFVTVFVTFKSEIGSLMMTRVIYIAIWMAQTSKRPDSQSARQKKTENHSVSIPSRAPRRDSLDDNNWDYWASFLQLSLLICDKMVPENSRIRQLNNSSCLFWRKVTIKKEFN